jgi:hypothetical protein
MMKHLANAVDAVENAFDAKFKFLSCTESGMIPAMGVIGN